MYSVRQNMETSAEMFFIPAWSEETLLFDLNLHNKNSQICTKEFSKCRRQSGWKSISVHRTCKKHCKSMCLLNSEIDKISFWPLKLRSFVFYASFHNNWMENRCWFFLKRCINVISGNACALACLQIKQSWSEGAFSIIYVEISVYELRTVWRRSKLKNKICYSGPLQIYCVA